MAVRISPRDEIDVPEFFEEPGEGESRNHPM
jgi:hypothetical protein